MANNLIWVIDHAEIEPKALSMLKAHGYQTLIESPTPSVKPTIVGLFVRTYTQVDRSLIHDLPNLKFILKAGVGLDNIDLALAKQKDIQIYNSPGSNAKSVAEYVIGSTIFLLHKLDQHAQNLRLGNWRSYRDLGSELAGKIFGMVGFGAVGREVAKRLLPFEVELLAYDPYIKPDIAESFGVKLLSLDELLSKSDIVSLQAPLTVETRGMLNKSRLSLLKPGAALINVSRGELLDEDALVERAQAGKFVGLALDVFNHEPKINQALLALPDTLLTPHIAGFTDRAHERMATDAVTNLLNSNPVKNI